MIRRPLPRLPVLGAAALHLAACGEAGPTGAGHVEVRDSLGIRIVENHRPAVADSLPWTVEATPDWAVGGRDEPDEIVFNRVGSVARLPDGRVAVADVRDDVIHLFDPEGSGSRSIGGGGEGPGEFRGLRWMAVDPTNTGHLLAYDLSRNVVLRLDTDGREVERIRIEPLEPGRVPAELESEGQLGSSHVLIGPFVDGSFLSEVFESWLPESMGPGPTWTQDVMMLHVRRDGSVGSVAGRFFRVEHSLSGGSGRLLAIPFGPRGITVPMGRRILHGDGARFELRLYERDGALARIWRRDWTPTPVTADERAEFRRRSLRSAGYDEGRPETEAVRILRRLLDRLPWPSHHRAFDALVPDTEGHLWVREDSSLSRWSVFDPDGRWLGAATLPAGLDVRQIGADYVLGIRTDELGVQEVRMHRLERR